eukprot:scaffold8462_cov110-Isochrysis_galbana.AAC.6
MGLARVYQSRQPLGGGRVDAPPKPLGQLGIAAVEGQQLRLEQLQELVGHGVVHQAEVRTHTRLARVDECSPHESSGGVVEVGRPVDDGGRLAAQLEHAGGQVLGRRGQHQLADEAGAGEADLVEALLEQRRRDEPVALGHPEAVGVEVFLDQPGDGVRAHGSVGARLDHHA